MTGLTATAWRRRCRGDSATTNTKGEVEAMTKVKALLATAVLVVLAALFGAGVIATSAVAEPRSVSSSTLTGTWNVTVNRPAPLPPLKSVQVFTSSGAMIEMANEPQASRTAQYGAWERIDGRLYAASGTLLPLRFPRESSRAPRRSTGRRAGAGRKHFPVHLAGERLRRERPSGAERRRQGERRADAGRADFRRAVTPKGCDAQREAVGIAARVGVSPPSQRLRHDRNPYPALLRD